MIKIGTFQKFIEWNKKILSDDSPAIAWDIRKDEKGNEAGKIFLFGSWIAWAKGDQTKLQRKKPMGHDEELLE